MSEVSKFRTAVSGFNRADVVHYIETISAEHHKALRAVRDERDKLAQENARLQACADEAQAQLAQAHEAQSALQQELAQVKTERDALGEQLNALADEGAQLAQQLQQTQNQLQQVQQSAAELPQDITQPQEPSLPEKELAAYRRAEQTERNAAVRARRVYDKLAALCDDARGRYAETGEEIAALSSDLATGLERLQDAFAEVQVIFDDAQNAFDEMQLPQPEEEEEAGLA